MESYWLFNDCVPPFGTSSRRNEILIEIKITSCVSRGALSVFQVNDNNPRDMHILILFSTER
ncbi:MAG: hypothetical protein LBC68_15380 [Prevotellaceae bacterium]|nr:hypothetical protein [Prevotellaceae bacterium]